MGDAAVKLAKKIKYQSAGTVEFLFDDKTEEFWFLEVNTRLQVEHPVTEEVTGIDLVCEQLRIARGEYLGYEQDDIEFSGSAIEARLYAEDPSNNFLPEIGTLIAFEDGYDADARWDSGVASGSVVGTDFDPMLAKVISYAPTRTDAAGKLARALESAHIGGVKTNRDFLIACLRSNEYLSGDTTTDFIDRVNLPRTLDLSSDEIEHVISLAALWVQKTNKENSSVLRFMPSGWTNGRLPKQNINLMLSNETHKVEYAYVKKQGFVFSSNKVAKIHDQNEFGLDVEFDGKRHFSRITMSEDQVLVHMPYGDVMVKVMPRFVMPGLETQAGGLVAPMPGKVIDLKVKKGSKVKAGDTLIILEAMKMEHSIKASENGTVSDLLVSANDQVENGALLMVVDPK